MNQWNCNTPLIHLATHKHKHKGVMEMERKYRWMECNGCDAVEYVECEADGCNHNSIQGARITSQFDVVRATVY